MTVETAASTRPTITYYYDALCGWCFGFAPTFDEFFERHRDDFNFNLVSGGLFADNPNKMRPGRVNEVAPHIKAGAYRSVEKRTGVRFGAAFLDDVFAEGELVLDSMNPAIAMAIVKDLAPDQTVAFARVLNEAVYVDGMHPTNIHSYGSYVEGVGLDAADFVDRMTDPQYRAVAEAEFALFSEAHDANVFPTVVVESEHGRTVLVEGQADLETLEERLATHLGNQS